jgi:hypothetical protein
MEINALRLGFSKNKISKKIYWGVEALSFQLKDNCEVVPFFCLFWDGTALMLDVLFWSFTLYEKK